MDLLKIIIPPDYSGPSLEELIERDYENLVFKVRRGVIEETTGEKIEEFLAESGADVDSYEFSEEDFSDEFDGGLIVFEKGKGKNAPRNGPDFIIFNQ